MELRSTEEARENSVQFATRLLSLLAEKKEIDDNIKALKEEFKEEGVAVAIVAKCVNKIKADKKMDADMKYEIEVVGEWLESDATIDNAIGELVS